MRDLRTSQPRRTLGSPLAPRPRVVAAAAIAAALLAGCGSTGSGSEGAGHSTTGAGQGTASTAAGATQTVAVVAGPPPKIQPARFSHPKENPWFPLRPGTRWRYRGTKDGKPAVDVVAVTNRTKTIQGVRTRVVSDRLYLDGKLEEETADWYAPDNSGTVWYLGEATRELSASGRTTSREGSWESGVDGARGGVYLFARPAVGMTARQEEYPGHAEDRFVVSAVHAAVEVPFGSSTDAVVTKETTPLEPGVVDSKAYARGVGTIRETQLAGPGHESAELVSMQKP